MSCNNLLSLRLFVGVANFLLGLIQCVSAAVFLKNIVLKYQSALSKFKLNECIGFLLLCSIVLQIYWHMIL